MMTLNFFLSHFGSTARFPLQVSIIVINAEDWGHYLNIVKWLWMGRKYWAVFIMRMYYIL